MTPIRVIAALVQREHRYLVGRRPSGKRHGGLWEFPGGKVLDGEDWLAAAARELAEELDMVVVSVGASVLVAQDPGSPFEIHFIRVAARGEPQPLEHSEVAWLTPEELQALPIAADAKMVRLLRRRSSGNPFGE